MLQFDGLDHLVDRNLRKQVTRHTSHVTRHSSHVTHHTSHITRQTSHITRHAGHVHHVTRHSDVQRGEVREPLLQVSSQNAER